MQCISFCEFLTKCLAFLHEFDWFVCFLFQDVIKGVMAWKKFPSQGLVSLANTPTLTNVWVPRWYVCAQIQNIIQKTLVIENTDITKSCYNKVNFPVPKIKIPLYYIVFAALM